MSTINVVTNIEIIDYDVRREFKAFTYLSIFKKMRKKEFHNGVRAV